MENLMNITGLTGGEVKKRIKEGRVNINGTIKTKTVKKIIFTNVCTFFNLVNGIVALTLIMVQSYKNILFLGVVIWNIMIGIIQEIRAKRIIDRLSLLTAPTAVVIRDGKERKIAVDEIVLDDICILRSGNQICSDAIIIDGSCEVNESLLTGESDPVGKKTGDEILSGSFIVSGSVVARVIHVGSDNYANSITNSAKYVKKINSEIFTSTQKIIKLLAICIVPVYVINFIKICYLRGDFTKAVVSSASLVVGMIPSGLMLLISIVLAVSVVKLSRHKALVQDMYCIENLARVDVLCLDKTGTITEGRMKVDKVIYYGDEDTVEEEIGEYIRACRDNNPTFMAIADYKKDYVSKGEFRVKNIVPFSSEKKYGLVEFERKGTYVLGAAEFILKPGIKCSCENKTADDVDIFKTIEEYEKEGKRVLLYAKMTDGGPVSPEALIIVSDVIRKEAGEMLSFFNSQGVNIKIISGDNAITVSRIAKQAGVIDSDNYIDASSLYTDEDVAKAALKYTVFGRVTPQQKLTIIKSLRENGHVVGMTGDGVNDVLALKEADCSISMQSGSDAARTVSNIVLMDSNFYTMPLIVHEGRKTINNLQRSSSLFLSRTASSLFLAIIFLIIPVDYPLQLIQLTLINGLAIGIPSFILAMEPNSNIVKGKYIKNVLGVAIPAGAFISLQVVAATLFAKLINASAAETSTMAVYAMATGFGIELFRICRPLNHLRRTLLIFVCSVFVAAIILFRNFFGVTLLSGKMAAYVAIMLTVMFIVRNIMKRRQNT